MKKHDVISATDKPVLLHFHADWCAPCKVQAPILKEVEAHYGDKIKFIYLNVEKEKRWTNKFTIFSVPTTVFVQNHKEIWKIVGVRSKMDFIKKIDKTLKIEITPKYKNNLFSRFFSLFFTSK